MSHNLPLVVFTVPGDPVPKERPRSATTRTGRTATYTPKRTVAYENQVAAAYLQASTPQARRLAASRTARFAIHVDFHRKSRRNCDLDNLMKSVLDGLNKIAYLDDSQVVELYAYKHIDRDNPRAEVAIYLAERTANCHTVAG